MSSRTPRSHVGTDWNLPPHNRWTFRHVREFVPTARIKGLQTAADPVALDRELAALEVGSGDQPEALEAFLAASWTDAFVVMRAGALTFEWYAPGVAPDDTHIVMSVSKSVAGLLAGTLERAGCLDLECRVGKLVPEVEGSAYGDASVRDLLDMTVSTAFVEDYTPGPDMADYRRATGWFSDERGPHGLHGFLAAVPAAGSHGEVFRYASPNADMLGWVCERAAGVPYADALSRHLWRPMGATSDADITLDRFGAAVATGGLCMTARDMARVGQIVVDDGAGVVGADFVRDLHSGGDAAPWARGEWADFLPGGAYRSCWYQTRDNLGSVLALGIHGQLIYVDRANGIVVAKQSSWPTPEDDAAEQRVLDVCRRISVALGGDHA